MGLHHPTGESKGCFLCLTEGHCSQGSETAGAVWEEQWRCLCWGISFLGHDSKAGELGDVLSLSSLSSHQ